MATVLEILILVTLGYKVIQYLQYVVIPAMCHILGFHVWAALDMHKHSTAYMHMCILQTDGAFFGSTAWCSKEHTQ